MKTTRRILVDPDKAVEINYKDFREKFQRVRELNERDEYFKMPDWEKRTYYNT